MLAAHIMQLVFIPMSPDSLAQPGDLEEMLAKVVEHCNASNTFVPGDDAHILRKDSDYVRAVIDCELVFKETSSVSCSVMSSPMSRARIV